MNSFHEQIINVDSIAGMQRRGTQITVQFNGDVRDFVCKFPKEAHALSYMDVFRKSVGRAIQMGKGESSW